MREAPEHLLPALERLTADGWLERVGASFAPSRRARAAMMRASASLVGTDAPEDVRVPVALALLGAYAADAVVPLVVAMSWAVAAEEARTVGARTSARPP